MLALTAEDLDSGMVTLRKCTTKGKIATRTLPSHPKLQAYLAAYDPPSGLSGLLFPGRNGDKPLTRAAADLILRAASTHSFRRTALTSMSNAKVPIRVIQEVSGHKSLTALQRYLEVKPDQVESAISLLI